MINEDIKDYMYCNDCNTYVDLYKFDNIEDTGHETHDWRYVTEEELKQCVEDCKENECFNEEHL